jgi:hypothetical protein
VEKITTKKFQLPKKLQRDLFEASGAADKYKGFILVINNERGDPMIFNEAEAGCIHFGLIKGLEKWLFEQSGSE